MFFTDTEELQEFERMMQTVPGFDREDDSEEDNPKNDRKDE